MRDGFTLGDGPYHFCSSSRSDDHIVLVLSADLSARMAANWTNQSIAVGSRIASRLKAFRSGQPIISLRTGTSMRFPVSV